MPLMERVRELGADQAQVDEAQVNMARQALVRRIARDTRSARRVWRPVLAGGGVAAVAIGAIVVASVLAPVSAPTASAAEALEQAAQATLTTEVLDPGPGQYIRIAERWTSTLSGWTDGDGSTVDVDYQHTATNVLYVPADRSGDWIDDRTTPAEITVMRGDPALAADISAAEDAIALGTGGHAGVEAHPGGRIFGGDGWQDHIYLLNPLARYYDEMPRDPQALLEWIETFQPEPGYGPPSLGDPVDFNLAPADLRVAMFHAIALADGAAVLRTHGDVTTIAFHEGHSTVRTTIDVDTARGLIVASGREGVPNTGRIDISIADTAPVGQRLPDAPQD